mgnify:CR=1 FL=1
MINHFSMTRLDEDLFTGLDDPASAATRRAHAPIGGSPAEGASPGGAGPDDADAGEAGPGHPAGPSSR